MDIKHLSALIAIADAGSITRAAEQIYIAQPALSNRLSALESELGVKLFVRSRQGVTLTDAGQRLYSHAKNIVKSANEALDEIKQEVSRPVGTIVLGFQKSLARFLGLGLFRKIHEQYPNIEIEFLSGDSKDLYNQLSHSGIDMAILHKDISVRKDQATLHTEYLFSSSTLEYYKLFEEEVFFCSARELYDIAGSDETTVPINALASARLISTPKHHAITRNIEWLANEHEIQLQHIARTDSPELCLDLVQSGVGCSFVPHCAVIDHEPTDKIDFRRVEGYRIIRTITLCCSPYSHMHTSARVIKDLILEHAPGFYDIPDSLIPGN